MTMPSLRTLRAGNISKDSEYLERIKDATSILKHPSHPRHHGIKMQAHHAISVKALSLTDLGPKFKKMDYNINLLPNLVFLPCTLQGACHLGIQPHRGDHTAPADHESYDDDEHPRGYHDIVAKELRRVDEDIDIECAGEKINAKETTQKHLNGLSALIIKRIQNLPTKYPLTSVAQHYTQGNPVGCGGFDAVGLLKDMSAPAPCAVKRSHMKKQKKGQCVEEIKYPAVGIYELKPGN